MHKAAFIYIILGLTLYSCVKSPTYPDIPEIAFVSVSKSNIGSGYADTITFSFTDGSGGIGVNTNTNNTCNPCALKTGDSSCLQLPGFNVFLIDGRDSCIATYASANVQSTGKNQGISGTIQVITQAFNTKCFGGCPCAVNDTVTYAIILRDMAGHLSNTVHTTPIAISACP